jgi:hypothetical protein
MDEIKSLVVSPAFWFAAIFVSLLINVIGNFFSDAIKRYRARASERYRAKLNLERSLFREEMEGLIGDDTGQILTGIQAFQMQAAAATLLGFAFAFLLFSLPARLVFHVYAAPYVSLGIGLLFLIGGSAASQRARRLEALVEVSRQEAKTRLHLSGDNAGEIPRLLKDE